MEPKTIVCYFKSYVCTWPIAHRDKKSDKFCLRVCYNYISTWHPIGNQLTRNFLLVKQRHNLSFYVIYLLSIFRMSPSENSKETPQDSKADTNRTALKDEWMVHTKMTNLCGVSKILTIFRSENAPCMRMNIRIVCQ